MNISDISSVSFLCLIRYLIIVTIANTALIHSKLIKMKKEEYVLFPTHVDIQGQWWSSSYTHTSQIEQWTTLGGLYIRQV